MVGRLARSDERCAWTMLVTTSTFVFLPAVQERLACMNEQEPLVFGRLAGRMNPKYPRIGGIPTPVPWLSAGIVISAGALEVPAMRLLESDICTQELAATLELRSGNETNADGVATNAEQVG